MTSNRNSSLKQPAIWLIAAGFVIVLFSIGLLLSGQNGLGSSPPSLSTGLPASLPGEIAGLRLVQQSQGQAAVEDINQMHGLGFALQTGSIGVYGPEQQATLWVAGVEDGAAAEQMVNEMRDKIALGRSPFVPTGQWEDDSRIVYSLEGMDQRHVYFQAGSQLVWLAVDPAYADEAIEEVLRYYSN